MYNVQITGIGVYHPPYQEDNEFFINHFNNQGIEIEGLFHHLDRDKRYLIKDNKETVISMAIESSQMALTDAELGPEDIDMIIFVSDNPEYTTPTNALMIHKELGLTNAKTVFDMNNNCIGMITAMDFVSSYLKQNPFVKNALIVGAQMVSYFARESDPILFGTVGDASAAIVLQKEEGNEPKGIINSIYHADSSLNDKMRFPATGMSTIFREEIPMEDKKMIFVPHDVSFFSDEWKKLIINTVESNNMKIEDIDHYLFSQFSHADIKETLDKLEVSHDKYTFIANQYGYTGCTSPIFALYHALKEGKIKKNSNVIFCSVGIGFTMVSLFYKF